MRTDFQYLVSVIIPVYNARKYLAKAISALKKQTLPQKKIEILLIDDGSTDGSPLLCDQFARKYNNVRVIHQRNAGVSAARNKGISEAKGKYIVYLDADDWLSKETLGKVTHFFVQHEEEIDIVGFTTLLCYPNGKKLPHARESLIKQSGIFSCDNREGINLTRLSVAVKNLGPENKRFHEELHFHEDEDYLVRVLARKAKFGYLKDDAVYWRGDRYLIYCGEKL